MPSFYRGRPTLQPLLDTPASMEVFPFFVGLGTAFVSESKCKVTSNLRMSSFVEFSSKQELCVTEVAATPELPTL